MLALVEMILFVVEAVVTVAELLHRLSKWGLHRLWGNEDQTRLNISALPTDNRTLSSPYESGSLYGFIDPSEPKLPGGAGV